MKSTQQKRRLPIFICEKIRQNERYTLCCCVCGERMGVFPVFRMFISHKECDGGDAQYYNVKYNRPIH